MAWRPKIATSLPTCAQTSRSLPNSKLIRQNRECFDKKDIPFREPSKQESQANGAHVYMAMHMGKGAGCKRQIASAEERRGEADSGSLPELIMCLISMLQENALDQVSQLDKTTDLVSLCLRVRKSDAGRRRLFVVISQASFTGKSFFLLQRNTSFPFLQRNTSSPFVRETHLLFFCRDHYE